MNKAVKRGLALFLSVVLILVSFSALAFWWPFPIPKRDPFPSNNVGMLCIRKVATDTADVGKAFTFTYTVNGGKPVSVVLAAGASSKTAYTYQQSLPLDSTIVVTEVLSPTDASLYSTTVNGSAGNTITVKLSGSQTMVEFVNSRVTIDLEAEDGQG